MFGDERDRLWQDDPAHPSFFADKTFREVAESAIYTDDGMFGDIAHDAQCELMRRLMRSFPPPDWAKGKY